MAAALSLVVPFLFYWVIVFVACFAVVEYGQNYLYDEATPSAGLKVAGGSALLAAILTWSRPEYHTMFTEGLGKTVLLSVAAFAVFTLIYRFQPWHALPIGVVTLLVLSGIATLGVQSFVDRGRPSAAESRPQSKPLRRVVNSTATTPVENLAEDEPPPPKADSGQ